METRGFYVTLPSNANMDIYPNNTQASYQVRLPRTLYLKNSYEVALVEAQYPISWKTFANEDSYEIAIFDRKAGRYQSVFIPNVYYSNLGELVKQLNKTLSAYFAILDNGNHAQLKILKLEHKIDLSIVGERLWIQFADEMSDVLGLEHKYYTGTTVAPYRHDISHGFHSLFVYCNVCEPQIVGDSYVPLLRTVAIKGAHGEYVTKTYGEPHYVPVNTDELSVIEMNIKDDTGQDVPFIDGKVVCKLHFRQRAI